MVVAANAGMLSASNLAALDEAGLKFSVGSRATKAPGDLASRLHWTAMFSPMGRSLTRSHHGTAAPWSRTAGDEPSLSGTRGTIRMSAGDLAVLPQPCRPDEKTLNAQEARARAVVDGDTARSRRNS